MSAWEKWVTDHRFYQEWSYNCQRNECLRKIVPDHRFHGPQCVQGNQI